MSSLQKSDIQIVALLQEGSKEGYEALYHQYGKTLYGVIHRMLMGNDEEAKDVLQDCMVKIWKNISQYQDDKGKFYTWILNIARNQSIDYLRSKNHQNQLKNQSIEDYVNSSEMQLKSYVQTDKIGLSNLLEVLKKDQRDIVDLVYFRGYTQEETAKKLSIPSGTVKTRLRAAMVQLRNYLKADIITYH